MVERCSNHKNSFHRSEKGPSATAQNRATNYLSVAEEGAQSSEILPVENKSPLTPSSRKFGVPLPTIYLLSEDLQRLGIKPCDTEHRVVETESEISDESNAVLVHIRSILPGCGTEVYHSKDRQNPLHLIQVLTDTSHYGLRGLQNETKLLLTDFSSWFQVYHIACLFSSPDSEQFKSKIGINRYSPC